VTDPRLNPIYVDAVKQLVETANYPSLLGMRLTAMDLDTCEVELVVDDRHLQPFGIVHGGVIATLIDTGTFWAAYMRLPEDAGLVNVDLKLNYLSAVPSDLGKLTVRGECLKPGRQISYAQAFVEDEAGRLIAHGTSTLMAIPGRSLNFDVPKFLTGSSPQP